MKTIQDIVEIACGGLITVLLLAFFAVGGCVAFLAGLVSC